MVAAWMHRACTLEDKKRFREALAAAESAVRLDPADATLHAYCARVAVLAGDLAAAEEHLAEARMRLTRYSHPRLASELVEIGKLVQQQRRLARAPRGGRPPRSGLRARDGKRPKGPGDRGSGAAVSAAPEPAPATKPPTADAAWQFELGPLAPPGSAAGAKVDPSRALADYRLRRSALSIEGLRTYDTLLALSTVHGVDHFEYQLRTVRRVLREFRGRVLLADEVGLGKTVEACLCLKEFLLRGMVRRTLILVPAALRAQWRDELLNKFDLPARVVDGGDSRKDPEVWRQDGILIASLGLARLAPHKDRILSARFDLVIVDEAHHLKNRRTSSWQLVDGLRSRFLLLLSATPIQNDLVEIYNVMTLLKPGLFSTEAEFKRNFVRRGEGRKPKDPARMRTLLREVMIRNTRALAEARLPPRFATTLRAAPGPAEAAFHDDLDRTVRARLADGALSLGKAGELLRAAGSSPAAAAASLARHLGPQWGARAARLPAEHGSAKDALLANLLSRRAGERVLLFAGHRRTLDHVLSVVRATGRNPVFFHGSMSAAQKEAAIRTFEEKGDVLVASESGGEGFNMQFSRVVVNYDLPWNPMRIEQRIGRVHRIGQTRDVFVFNLVTAGTIEEEILRVLDEKINMFELVVGEIDAILGRVGEDEQEFENLVLAIYTSADDRASIRRGFDELAGRMLVARDEYVRVKDLETKLFGRDLEA